MPSNWLKLPKADSFKGLQLVQLIRYAAMFGIGIVLVKAGLSKEAIGNFESLIFLAGAVSFFWITGVIQSLLPLYKKPDETGSPNEKSAEFFNAWLILLFFSAAAAGFVILFGKWLSGVLDSDLGADLIYYLATYVFLQGPVALIEYIYLLKKEAGKMITYGWIAFGIQFLAVSITAILGLELYWILTALIASTLIRYIWLIRVLRQYSAFRISWSFIGRHLKLGGPIIASVFLSGSAQYVDGLIVTANFDQGVFAVFRYGARELPLVALLAHALSSAMVPELTEKGPVAGLRQLREKTQRLATWLFPVTLGFILTSHLIFPLVYDHRFLESATIFNVYLLIIITRLTFPQTLLIAFKKTGFLMQASALELIANVGLSLIFVQYWGIMGVAWATIVAYVFERVLLTIYVKVILGLRLKDYLNVRMHLIWSLIVITALILTELFVKDLIHSLIL